MEDEFIDLRVYIKTLVQHWYWIVGLALVAAVTAFLVTSAMPESYEAQSVVMITKPQYQVEFEPRMQNVAVEPAYRAFPVLATSDGVLKTVVDSYTPTDAAQIEEWSLDTLKGMVESTSEGDPRLVLLTVTSRSGEDAAAIANAWAASLTRRGNEIYNDPETNIAFFEAQFEEAEAELTRLEEEVIAYQAQNRSSIVRSQLQSLEQTQSDYLADKRTIAYLIQDLKGLRSQLATQPGDQPASLADDLTALYLQIKAFNAQASAPIQIQVNNPESLSQKSFSEQVAFLDQLTETLEAKAGEIDERLAALEPEILALQERLQSIETEADRLARERDLAKETYMSVARKLEETRVASQEENNILRVGSQAGVPTEPAGSGTLMNTAIAGALGGMLGVGGVLILEWWQNEDWDAVGERVPEAPGGERRTL